MGNQAHVLPSYGLCHYQHGRRMRSRMNLQYIKKIFLFPLVYISILLISSLITSCTQISKPPTSWEASEKTGSERVCGDISGIYQNKGIAAPNNKSDIDRTKHPKYLSEYFSVYRVNGFEQRWVTHLELTPVTNDEFKVVFKQNDRIIDTKTLHRKKDFMCTSQGITLIKDESPVTPYGPEFSSYKNTMYKIADGSLILNESHSEAGVFGVIPYAGTTVKVFKFPAFIEKKP